MEVPRQDLRLIRDALIMADVALRIYAHSDPQKQVERALTRANWLLADARDPLEERGDVEITRGWLKERPEDDER